MLHISNKGLLKYCFFLMLFSLPSASCQRNGDKDNIIVQIEDRYTINFGELRKYVYDWHFDKMYRLNKTIGYQKGLDEMINKQLKVIDFFALGLQNNEELLRSIRRTLNEELVIEYYKTQHYDKYVNDKSIRDSYRELGKEVVYQRIVIIKPKDAPQGYLDTLKTVVAEIKTLIDNGTDFSELAKQYSQDGKSSGSGGLMPAINWKTSMANDQNNKIFNLDSGEEYIFEDKQSIIIVKVIEIKKADVKPFEEVKDDIKQTLNERYTDISLKEFYGEKDNSIDKNSLKWDMTSLKQLVEWSNIPSFYKSMFNDTLSLAISQGNNFPILEHSTGKVDLKEYLRLLNDVLIWNKYTSLKEEDVKKFIIEAKQTNMLIDKAKKLNLEQNIFNPGTDNPAIRRDIIRLYNQQVIELQIPVVTDSSLRKFYEDNKDSLFYQLAKVNIYAIIDSDKKNIDDLILKLNRKIPFEKITGQAFVKIFIMNRDGSIESFLNKETPFLGREAFKLRPDETAGPIEYNDPEKGKQYALIKCIVKREEKQLLYKDVEKTIADEFVKYYRNKITLAVQAQLKKKYSVTIYNDILKQNLSAIGINTN